MKRTLHVRCVVGFFMLAVTVVMGGCQTASSFPGLASPIAANDLTRFTADFVREALAAFLF